MDMILSECLNAVNEMTRHGGCAPALTSSTRLFPVTQSLRKNVWQPGFAFLAVLAWRSVGYIENCDIYRKKHSCRCYVLPGLHKTTSAPPRFFDARDATTQNRDLKHTKCHHLDPNTLNHEVGVDVFEIVDSVGMRFSIMNAVCMGTTCDQAWIARELRASVLRRHMHVYELSYMAGRVGLVGLSLFAAIEEHTIEAHLVRLSSRMVW